MNNEKLKELLTPEFVEKFNTIFLLLLDTRKEIKEHMGDEYPYDLEWDEIQYFSGFMENVSEYLHK